MFLVHPRNRDAAAIGQCTTEEEEEQVRDTEALQLLEEAEKKPSRRPRKTETRDNITALRGTNRGYTLSRLKCCCDNVTEAKK